MFLGEYNHSTDEKGRLTIPSKLRESFLSGLVITRGFDHCLYIYTTEAWEKVAGRLSSGSQSKKTTRDFIRFFLSSAYELVPDAQGRILLPGKLREFAGIKTEVVITGALDHLEVWTPDEWNKVIEKVQQNAEETVEELDFRL